MIGLFVVKSESNSLSDRPCGCSLCGCSVMRSTTLTTRIFRSGKRCRRISTAASVSSVGTSPASHYNVRLRVVVIAGPLPDPDARGAMLHRRVYIHVLQRRLFACDHDVDVVVAAQ